MNAIYRILKFPKEVRLDIDANWLVMGVLCLGMIPNVLAGYSMYLLFLLAPLLFKTNYDLRSVVVLLFGFLYTFAIVYRNEEMFMAKYIFLLIYPIVIFQSGRYLGTQLKSLRTLTLLMAVLAFLMAFPTIVENVRDYIATGQFVSTQRALEVAKGHESGATIYGITLSLALGLSGVVLLSTHDRFTVAVKFLCVGMALLALFSTLHLVNRSGLYIAAFSVVMGAALPPFTRKRVFYALLIFAVAYAIFIIYLETTPEIKEVFERYQYREENENSTASLGGRDRQWHQGWEHLFNYPMGGGNSITYHGRSSYAHNAWLDCGAQGGVPALIMLLIMTFMYIWDCFRLLFYKTVNTFGRNLMLMLAATFMVQFMVEPMIEAVIQYFWLWLFFWSAIHAYMDKHKDQDAEEYEEARLAKLPDL